MLPVNIVRKHLTPFVFLSWWKMILTNYQVNIHIVFLLHQTK